MEPPASATTPRLAWKWILEKLLDLPDLGVAFINEVITSHVKDIEEPHSRPLLERVALRSLEEMVCTNQIDSGAIPLLKAVTKQDDVALETTGASVNKQRSNEELMLRVQTEAVLSVLRKCVDEGDKNWAFFESELERVFGEAGEDNRLLERKRELSALLKSNNQTKATVTTCFEKYSLNKLRNDLFSFVDQKRESFKTNFLDQLSRDFLDANGRPFSEKATKVEANGKQNDVCTVNAESSHEFEDLGDRNCQQAVGQNPKVNGTQGASGKKRLRWKLLPIQDGVVGDGGSDEAEEGRAGTKKLRKVSSTSIANPLKISLRSPVKQEVGLCQLLFLLNGGKELSGPTDLGPEVMRSCSPAAHERGIISMEGAKIPPREPSRTNKYVSVSDVELDADSQVVKRLSTGDGDSLVEEGDGDKLQNKRGAPSLSENGSARQHPQNIVETEAVRKETSIEQSEKKLLVYNRRKEAFAGALEVTVSQQEDNEKSVTNNEFIPLDSQDIYKLDFLEVGSDAHEEVCHVCGKHGELRGCDGCPICMDFDCINILGLRLPKSEEDWYCPVCLFLKAEKAAVAAKEKLKAFHMESKRRRSSPEGDALHHRNQKQEKAAKQSGLRISSLQSGEKERALMKPKQQSDEEPKLRYTEGQQQDSEEIVPGVALHLRNQRQEKAAKQLRLRVSSLQSGEIEKGLMKPKQQQSDEEPTKFTSTEGRQQDADPSKAKASLVSTVLRKALRQLNQLSDRDSDQSLPEDASPEVARRDPFAPSTSGQVKPGSGAGGRRDIEGDEGVGALDEDRGEKPEDRKQDASLSGRRKLPGVRRKPLPWTRQEEHALKEGVKRFSHNGSWGFQWRKILEFGRGSFDPSRTDVDLKDKWRNLVKGFS